MIHVEEVSVAYPDGTRALSGVDLHVAHGEFAFIVGASGSGKSTLLRLLYRDLTPTEGRVLIAGQDVAALPRSHICQLRRKIGVVFQDFRLLPEKTVWENVAFAMDVMGASRREKYRNVPLALELVGLTDRNTSRPSELSGGEQQRVSIARALVNSPPILLADEPTGNLDPDISWEIVQLLAGIAERGTTVLCATHDRYIVDGLRKRVISLVGGTVVRDDHSGGGYDEA